MPHSPSLQTGSNWWREGKLGTVKVLLCLFLYLILQDNGQIRDTTCKRKISNYGNQLSSSEVNVQSFLGIVLSSLLLECPTNKLQVMLTSDNISASVAFPWVAFLTTVVENICPPIQPSCCQFIPPYLQKLALCILSVWIYFQLLQVAVNLDVPFSLTSFVVTSTMSVGGSGD